MARSLKGSCWIPLIGLWIQRVLQLFLVNKTKVRDQLQSALDESDYLDYYQSSGMNPLYVDRQTIWKLFLNVCKLFSFSKMLFKSAGSPQKHI